MGFIDMHSHILPGIDDGARSMEQTILMLKLAYEEGIRTMVATSHYYPDRFHEPAEVLRSKLEEVNEAMKDILPDLNLVLGCEIYYSHENIRLIKEGIIPTMGGTNYILVEFSPLAEYRYLKSGLSDFILEGYIPILAHVERYNNVVKDMSRVKELMDMGVCIQVNAMSVTGETGKTYQSITKKLLKNEYVHIIATDAHSDRTRAPRMKKCYELVSKKYSREYANELFGYNQTKILNNQYL
ncbi:MAG: CpsB/CapC family capsule biosynthesis tyrosine phosphatase [Anaerocolumna sp.]